MIPTVLAFALLPLAADPQGPVSAETPVRALEALIERTNAMDAFRARYVMRKGEDTAVLLVLTYEAPDRMRLDMNEKDGDDRRAASTWIVGTRLAAQVERGDGQQAAGDVDFARLPGPVAAASAEMEARFPGPERALGPGCAVDMHWGVDEQTDKAEFDVQLRYQLGGRATLVQWLDHLRRVAEACTLDDETLSWRSQDDRIAVRVSLRTGFLETLDLVGSDGETMEMRLEELDLAPELSPDAFDVPPRAEGAQEVFPDGGARLLGDPAGLRRALFARVAAALRDGGRSWDEATREDAGAVLRVLHTGLLAPLRTGMEERVAERADALAAWMRAELAKADPPSPGLLATLDETADQWRDALVRSIDGELVRALAALDEAEAPAPSEHLADLLELERAIVGEVYDTAVRGPLLAILDERVDAVLGR